MQNIRLIFLFLISSIQVWAQDIPNRPNPPRLVNDFTSLLSRNEKEPLEEELVNFARQTSTQIVIVVVKSLDGDEISDYAFKLGEKWGIGQEETDNGVLIVLKPKTISEKGEVFIATGYGIEHLIPDVVADQIAEYEMIPEFKQNDYYSGLSAGIKVIMDLTREAYTAEAYSEHVKSKNNGKPFLFLVFLLIFVLLPLLRGRRGCHYSSGRSSLPFWIALGMMGSHRSSHSGTFGNFTSGGGGFGGFGGGSFGGGGAGGSW
ncbi:MAG: TPM domain-containing protein [Prolixibacteraceae bacterium]|nr:TPM domain-containing protein [Prolixibacteraceae bacterium]